MVGSAGGTTLSPSEVASSVPEDRSRLQTSRPSTRCVDINYVVNELRRDRVVVERVSPDGVDALVHTVANALGLLDGLTLQAGFAEFLGHRRSIGNYFMTVNSRDSYQFVTPHSEGDRFANMQLACFYCYENTTDGGATILFNVDDSSSAWSSLREKVVRRKPSGKPLALRDAARARALYRFDPMSDMLRHDDQILGERETDIPGLVLVDVLATPQRSYSTISGRKSYVYWDSIGSVDRDSVVEYSRVLQASDMLKNAPEHLTLTEMDHCADRRIWSSGARFCEIFTCKVTLRLSPGEILFLNNLTWAHAVSNWTPSSGVRNVAAAFA